MEHLRMVIPPLKTDLIPWKLMVGRWKISFQIGSHVNFQLGGGFKNWIFSPLLGEDEPILTNMFQRGWFNHQLVKGVFFGADGQGSRLVRDIGDTWPWPSPCRDDPREMVAVRGEDRLGEDEMNRLQKILSIWVVSKNRGTPKWMVYNGNPYSNGWFGGTTIFGSIHIYIYIIIYIYISMWWFQTIWCSPLFLRKWTHFDSYVSIGWLNHHLVTVRLKREAPQRKSLCTYGVSENNGTPKSSILIGFSIINHPFWGTTIFGTPHMRLPLKTCGEL